MQQDLNQPEALHGGRNFRQPALMLGRNVLHVVIAATSIDWPSFLPSFESARNPYRSCSNWIYRLSHGPSGMSRMRLNSKEMKTGKKNRKRSRTRLSAHLRRLHQKW